MLQPRPNQWIERERWPEFAGCRCRRQSKKAKAATAVFVEESEMGAVTGVVVEKHAKKSEDLGARFHCLTPAAVIDVPAGCRR